MSDTTDRMSLIRERLAALEPVSLEILDDSHLYAGHEGRKNGAGRYRLMYFGYTYCPDVCPVDLQKLMAGYKQLEDSDPELAAKIAPIFVSVDPERDTPPVLKQYVTAFSPKLIGLTGTPEQIAKVAKEYAIVYSKEQKPGATDYLMNHSRVAYLFGPKGDPIALIPQDGTPDAIAAELKRWVR